MERNPEVVLAGTADQHDEPLKHSRIQPAEKEVRLIMCGAGRYFEKALLPAIGRLQGRGRKVRIVGLVDVLPAQTRVSARAKAHGIDAEQLYIEPFENRLPARAATQLRRLIRQTNADAMMIATPPEAHLGLALVGISEGVNVFLEKPVTARAHAVTDLNQARGILRDVMTLVDAVDAARRRGHDICVTVGCQRRHDPIMQYAKTLVQEVADDTGCPVTALMVSHGDGQFRLPHELMDIDYHGFGIGNGKVSHSGIHFIDQCYSLMKASWRDLSRPDHAAVHASFVQPHGLLHQVPQAYYRKFFGAEYDDVAGYHEHEIAMAGPDMGETDAMLRLEFMRGADVVALANISLFHNSVSARSWLQPRQDLYKKNGRLKHEAWEIQSGPFQTINVETRQADDIHDRAGAKDTALGGPNHRELRVWRNAGHLGGSRLEVVQAHELPGFDAERLSGDQAKCAAVGEFMDFVQGRIDRDKLLSDLSDHIVPAAIMSAAYASHILHRSGGNGFVKVNL